MSLLDNLISYWKLDEASGSAIDSHGANALTDANTVTSAAGKIGTARSFAAAASEYLTVADNADLSTGNIDFSMAAWVNLASKNAILSIVGKFAQSSPTDAREYFLCFDNVTDRFQFHVSSNGTSAGVTLVSADAIGSPALDTWYLVYAWHDAANDLIGIRANGGGANAVAHATGLTNMGSAFQIGARGNGSLCWNGQIDEVAFWKRLLSDSEQSSLYNSGNGLAYPLTTNRPAALYAPIFGGMFPSLLHGI